MLPTMKEQQRVEAIQAPDRMLRHHSASPHPVGELGQHANARRRLRVAGRHLRPT